MASSYFTSRHRSTTANSPCSGAESAYPGPWHLCLPKCKRHHAAVEPGKARTGELLTEAERILSNSRDLVAKAEARLFQAQDIMAHKPWGHPR